MEKQELDIRRGQLSSRRKVVHEANRRGLLIGMVSRVGRPIGRAEAKLKAVESMVGDQLDCAIPERWRPLFKRVFVKAVMHATADRQERVAPKGAPFPHEEQ